MQKILVYGAYGYTGSMVAEHLVAMNQNIVISGRNPTKLETLRKNLNVSSIALSLESSEHLDTVLSRFDIVINCAGPFHRTAEPLMTAAIRTKTHYLDISAELDSYKIAEELCQEAMNSNVLLMPGCGGSVAMIGCLTAFAKTTLPEPISVKAALHVSGAMSKGSAVSASENLSPTLYIRKAGKLIEGGNTSSRQFDFGFSVLDCFSVTLPDVMTLWRDTKASDISTYVHVSGNAFPAGDLNSLNEGPTQQERDSNRYHASVKLADTHGTKVTAVLETINGYSFTPLAAALAAKNVAEGKFEPGFRTTAELWGHEFILQIPSTNMKFIL